MNLDKRSSSKGHLKFAPLKLIVIESRGQYYRTILCAFGVGLCHVIIGAIIMVAIMYTVRTGDIHVALCTVGYQFFSAEAILGLSYVNGWTAPLRSKHRRLAHIILQISGIICSGIGMCHIVADKGLMSTVHSKTGFITAFLTVTCIVTGPFGLHSLIKLKLLHVAFGVPNLIMASICICLGFYTKEFRGWADPPIVYTLTAILIFCTSLIFMVTFMKCMWWLRKD